MPGRGNPWRKGGHVDDTIESADIAQGTIKEEDLDTALTAKVNAGGHTIQDEGTPLIDRGNLNFVGAGVVASDGIEDTTTVTIAGGGAGIYEKLFETTLSTAVSTFTATITPAVNLADYAEFILIVHGSLSANADVLAEINGITQTDYENYGVQSDANTGSLSYSINGNDGWVFNNAIGPNNNIFANTDFQGKMVIIGGGQIDSNDIRGYTNSAYRNTVPNNRFNITGGIHLTNLITPETQLTQFRIFTSGANLKIGTKISVFGVKTA